jgi:hypothetical protein
MVTYLQSAALRAWDRLGILEVQKKQLHDDLQRLQSKKEKLQDEKE